MGRLIIDISDELIKLFPSKRMQRQRRNRLWFFDLVRRGKISKGRAVELLGINLWIYPNFSLNMISLGLITHLMI